jgi:uncharacterized protein (TIRG00374 family)
MAWLIIAGFVVGGAVLVFGVLALYRHRWLLKRIVHPLARVLGGLIGRIVGKEIYRYDHVELAIDDFYSGIAHVEHDPGRVLWAFVFCLLRLGFDAASLFFAFWAIGFDIAPGLLLVIFTTSNALSTLSGIPGELGVMEGSLAMLSTSLGIAGPVAVGAIVLFRALSYWLPLPLGYLAFWHLQRKGFI